MVYKNDFVAVVMYNGQILREDGGSVKLPFGAEYSVRVKNKNTVRALVNVEVDGRDALDGNSLVVAANSDVDLEGFMKGRNVTNHFKFIQKTKQIAEHRGDRIDDGMIRVEFQFEKQLGLGDFDTNTHFHYHTPTYYKPPMYGDFRTTTFSSDVDTPSYNVCDSSPKGLRRGVSPSLDEGITVEGSESNQSFCRGTIGVLETTKSVINICLRGVNSKGNTLVRKPVTVKAKLTCSSCGKRSKSSFKYCPTCGTFLR